MRSLKEPGRRVNIVTWCVLDFTSGAFLGRFKRTKMAFDGTRGETQRTKVLMLVALERENAPHPHPHGLGCKVKEGVLGKRTGQDGQVKAQHTKEFGVMVG